MAKSIPVQFVEDLHCDGSQEEQRKWAWLRNELSAGIAAAESNFVPLDPEDLLARAKARKNAGSC